MSIIQPGTHADLNTLLTNIVQLQIVTTNQIAQLENYLHSYSLPITIDASDTKLVAAVASSWPKSLGTPEKFVSYRYYKTLGYTNSAAALYIRQRYEEAARNVKGTNAVDLISVDSIINREANYIDDFVTNYVNPNLSDSSQQRTVELLQEWSDTALSYTRQLGTVFGQGIAQSAQLPASDVESISPKGAQQAQAIFTVKLNLLNSEIEIGLDSIEKQFSNFAGIFYNNFLGPALAFRDVVTSNLVNFAGTTLLHSEVQQASNALDVNLTTALADLMRRGQNFFTQIGTLLYEISIRDAFINYIEQLENVGMIIPVGTPGVMIQQTDSQTEATYFDNLTPTDATPSFSPLHSDLSELTQDDHPQYLLRTGGDLSGNVTMDGGVLIDHMRPGTHAHTGADGTTQIDGSNITFGTIISDQVNTGAAPITPTNLSILSQTVYLVAPGTAQVQVDVAWDGDSTQTLSYEVQVVPVT